MAEIIDTLRYGPSGPDAGGAVPCDPGAGFPLEKKEYALTIDQGSAAIPAAPAERELSYDGTTIEALSLKIGPDPYNYRARVAVPVSNGNTESGESVTLTIYRSVDAGVTWIAQVANTIDIPAGGLVDCRCELPPTGPFTVGVPLQILWRSTIQGGNAFADLAVTETTPAADPGSMMMCVERLLPEAP